MRYSILLFFVTWFYTADAQSGLHPKWVNETEVIYYDRSGKIWIHNVESMERRELTRGSQPAPNPMKEGIYALRKKVNDKSGIVIMDETRPDDLLIIDTKVEGLNSFHPIWSFDGRYLAFNAEHRENKTSTLYIYDYEQRRLQAYLADKHAGAPSFFPNGDILLPTRSGKASSLLRFDVKTGKSAILMSDEVSYFFADVSPDGAQLVVSVMEEGAASQTRNLDLWTLDLKSSKRRQLTNTGYPEYGARWSPSGKQLILFSELEGQYHVLLMDANGENLINLTAQTNDK